MVLYETKPVDCKRLQSASGKPVSIIEIQRMGVGGLGVAAMAYLPPRTPTRVLLSQISDLYVVDLRSCRSLTRHTIKVASTLCEAVKLVNDFGEKVEQNYSDKAMTYCPATAQTSIRQLWCAQQAVAIQDLSAVESYHRLAPVEAWLSYASANQVSEAAHWLACLYLSSSPILARRDMRKQRSWYHYPKIKIMLRTLRQSILSQERAEDIRFATEVFAWPERKVLDWIVNDPWTLLRQAWEIVFCVLRWSSEGRRASRIELTSSRWADEERRLREKKVKF